MHCFAFATEIANNEVFTYHQAMKQDDHADFIKAMEKKIGDHEEQNHWDLVLQSTIPDNAKVIKAIWSFKRKRFPYSA
jgi:hypothetical protein